MSEQLKDTYDVLKTAEMYADPALNEQLNADDRRMSAWLGEAGSITPEAATDVANYLGSRPVVEDKEGALHNATNGKFLSKDDAGKHYERRHIEHDTYETMSPLELARLSAEAEVRGDRTTMLSVDDALQNSLIKMGLGNKTTYEDKNGEQKERKSEQDIVFDRVMDYREKYLAEINGEQEAHEANMAEVNDKPVAEDKPAAEFAAPNAEDMIVKSYVNAEGKPVIEGREFKTEIEKLVAAGDKENFNRAAEAMWSAARAEARRTGNQNIMKNVKDFLEYQDGKLNAPAVKAEVFDQDKKEDKPAEDKPSTAVELYQGEPVIQEPVKVSLKDKLSGRTLKARFDAWVATRERKENQSRAKRYGMIGLGVAAAAAAGVAAYKLGAHIRGNSHGVEGHFQPNGGSGNGANNAELSNMLTGNRGGNSGAGNELANMLGANSNGAESTPFSLPEGFNLDAMPFANASRINPSNPNQLIQQTLENYNQQTGANFVLTSDGFFRAGGEGGRIINPAELHQYNETMARIAEEMSKPTLPVTQ